MKERETRSEVAGFPQLAINEGKPPPQVCPPCGRGGVAAEPPGGLVSRGEASRRPTIPPSRLRRASSLSARPAVAAHAERPLGGAHLSGVVGRINICCPFYT